LLLALLAAATAAAATDAVTEREAGSFFESENENENETQIRIDRGIGSDSSCGHNNINNNNNNSNKTYDGATSPAEVARQPATRIVGGRDAAKNRYPYFVSLRESYDGVHKCGGSLVAPDVVVTAAHCQSNIRYAQVGKYHLSGSAIDDDENENENDDDDEEEEGRSKPSSSSSSRVVRRRIDTLGEYRRAAGSYRKKVRRRSDEEDYEEEAFSVSRDDRGRDVVDRAIFLEGGSPDDFGLTLHLRGAEWIDGDDGDDLYGGRSGILYRPLRFYDDDDDDVDVDDAEENEGRTSSNAPRGGDDHNHRKATSFVWYRSILETTMSNEPVLSCYGLHEWAMQYRPEGAPPPPSGKYQSHLTLRVSREEINATVERKGIRCTHVDALRFFAPGAGELNRHGSVLERTDQLDLEQPGCVHAHMDLLKVALRIQPLLDPDLLIEILSTALDARALDVGASPYDCSGYSLVGGDRRRVVEVIPIETSVGRDLYRKLQTDLMREASAVRADLLSNYEAYGALAFTPTMLQRAIDDPGDERFARAVPGGRSWRRSLFDRPAPRGTNDDDDETGVTTKKKKRKKKEGSS